MTWDDPPQAFFVKKGCTPGSLCTTTPMHVAWQNQRPCEAYVSMCCKPWPHQGMIRKTALSWNLRETTSSWPTDRVTRRALLPLLQPCACAAVWLAVSRVFLANRRSSYRFYCCGLVTYRSVKTARIHKIKIWIKKWKILKKSLK
jgi:hypothetical protein